MKPFRRLSRQLAQNQKELHEYCDMLNIRVRIKKPRWRYLRNCDAKLITDAIALIKEGALKREEINPETVRRIMRNRRRRERWRDRKDAEIEQRSLDTVNQFERMLKRWGMLP